MNDRHYDTPSPFAVALRNCCPRCGEGALFNGFLSVKEGCGRCGLPYRFAEAGDGPAVFVILVAGAFIVAAALFLELAYAPPFWVHMLVFLPLTLILCLGLLRPLKGLLIAVQFQNQSEQGRRQT